MSKIRLPLRFPAYIVTQSLGAFNDNFYKMLLQLYVLQILVNQHSELIISEATFLFTIPFVLFGPWSGHLADKYSKSRLMRVIKFAEIGVMLIGVLAFYLGNLHLLLGVLFLMATQSTFFSPAKYGYIPEAARPEAVTSANGWVEMSTFLSIILGTAVTGIFLSLHNNNPPVVAFYCVGVAVLGALSSLRIAKVPAAGTDKSFPWNPLSGIIQDIIFLKKQKALFLAALANSYFWMLGLIFQTNILIYGKNMLGEEGSDSVLLSLLPAFIGLGIGAGSMLASRLSGKKVEVGLVPLGGMGMAVAGTALYFTIHSYVATSIILFAAGALGGLYIVPLYAYLQFYANEKEKGRVMATTGILNGLFMVLGAIIYRLLAVDLALPAHVIYLIMGMITVVTVTLICRGRTEYFLRFCYWILTHTVYRVKTTGVDYVPFRGAALLACNHVSYVDTFLLSSTVQRYIHFLVQKESYNRPVIKMMLNLMNALPLDPDKGRSAVTEKLNLARQQLQNQHIVCIFPEGKVNRNGHLQKFRLNIEHVMQGLDCPIIPVYMHNIRGSIFGLNRDKNASGWMQNILRPIIISFGEPLPPHTKVSEVEAAVRAMARKFEPNDRP